MQTQPHIGMKLYASYLGLFANWEIVQRIEGSNDWICSSGWRREPLSKLRGITVFEDHKPGAFEVDALTFDFDDVPMINKFGRHIDIKSSGRCEVTPEGEIKRIEVLCSWDGRSWELSPLTPEDSFYQLVAAGIADYCGGLIQDLIADYAHSKPGRGADKVLDQRKHEGGFY